VRCLCKLEMRVVHARILEIDSIWGRDFVDNDAHDRGG